MNEKDNVARFPTVVPKLDRAQRHTVERIQDAVRDYCHAGQRLSRRLREIDTMLLIEGAVDHLMDDASTDLAELGTAVSNHYVRMRTVVDLAQRPGRRGTRHVDHRGRCRSAAKARTCGAADTREVDQDVNGVECGRAGGVRR
ncbi:hypothetical protein [Nocardia pseudobrasiliensis]|uniref:Uncharacterized protein n=1 Tax=Nocardia pseudobrasiliensis TaxID=45979 RepID=A0A370ICU3_9NOCA|nr:hypothetical protein [Nocardia pseudobrasiliensis]RDI68430.1 hypothetical protein DFR76_102831 [Nocardia pseudobrasiliensis]